MSFNSIDFLLFFPIAVFVYFVVPQRVKYVWLLVCSYYFYMCWNVKYVLLLLLSTVITYASGLLMAYRQDKAWRRLCLVSSFVINLAILIYFKYANFFITNINTVLGHAGMSANVPAVDVLLPVGISFYTFQALSYSADVYKGKTDPERNFVLYALYVSFFPQLVAGPIEKSEALISQFRESHKWDFDRAREGVLLMLWGYFLKMVVADRIAVYVDLCYSQFGDFGGWYLIVATVLFAFQVYGDFAGYTTIAMGAAWIMGYKLTDNFNAPYASKSIAEFWNRWHISLNRWFIDYVYTPLGGSRKGRLRKYINILVVFIVSGMWHGAGWSYIIWGVLNGMYQITGELLRPVRDWGVKVLDLDRESIGHKIYQVLATFVLFDFTLVFFRADSTRAALIILKSMFTVHNPGILFDGRLFEAGLDERNFVLMVLCIIVVLIADACKYNGIQIRGIIAKQAMWLRVLVIACSIVFILLFGMWGSGYNAANFIYFQF